MLSISMTAFYTSLSSAAGDWAQFYTDSGCTNKIGGSVALNNPGCLTGPSASIKFHRDGWAPTSSYAMVVTPKGGCYCQSHCEDLDMNKQADRCIRLDGNKDGGSYRFLSGSCADNDARNNC